MKESRKVSKASDSGIKENIKRKSEYKEKKRSKITIPSYTLGEELLNSISHGVGALLGVAALVLCVVMAALKGNVWGVVSGSIYGASLIILYTMSTIYHALKVNRAKKVFRVIDHCSIYFLIAGTYTPYTLVTLRGGWGWTLFGIVWGAAILGITLNAIDIKKFKILSMITYLAMGWVIIIAIKPMLSAMAPGGLWLLLLGGISYTIGAVLYGMGKKKRYVHGVFHIFVVIGSVLHFFSILFYVM